MNFIKASVGILILSGLLSIDLQGQHTADSHEKAGLHTLKHNRLSVLMYHTYARSKTSEGNHLLVIPALGLDYEYWFSHTWGLGWHNDLSITHKVERDILSDRSYPFLTTIDGLWKPYRGLVLLLGPGVEFEEHEELFFVRCGIEYEFELGHHWDVCPTFFIDNRKNAISASSFGIGIGKRF